MGTAFVGNAMKKDIHKLVYEQSCDGLQSAYGGASFWLGEREILKFARDFKIEANISVFGYRSMVE